MLIRERKKTTDYDKDSGNGMEAANNSFAAAVVCHLISKRHAYDQNYPSTSRRLPHDGVPNHKTSKSPNE